MPRAGDVTTGLAIARALGSTKSPKGPVPSPSNDDEHYVYQGLVKPSFNGMILTSPSSPRPTLPLSE